MKGPAATAVDVSFGPRQRRLFVGITAALVALGAFLVFQGLVGDEGRVALCAIGGTLLVLGALLARATPKVLRRRTLHVDERGIRLEDTGPRSFSVDWEELAQVRASHARKGSQLSSAWIRPTEVDPTTGPRRRFGVSVFVRLDLVPADRTFLERHPDMRRYQRFTGRPPGVAIDPAPWSDDLGDRQAVLRVPFGDLPELLLPVDAALRAHAGARYHPPVDEGLALGFRYS